MHAFVAEITEAVSYREIPEINVFLNEINLGMTKTKLRLNAKKEEGHKT